MTRFFFTVCRSLRPATIIKLQTCGRCSWQRESEDKSYFTRHQRFIPPHLLMVSSVYLRWWSGRPEALNHTHDRACGAGLFSACLCEPYAAKKTKQTYHVLLFLQVTPTCTPAPDPVSLCTQSAIVLIHNEGRSCLLLSFFFSTAPLNPQRRRREAPYRGRNPTNPPPPPPKCFRNAAGLSKILTDQE